MTKYIILEKARPYTRYRRGKLEHVKSYPSRPKTEEETKLVFHGTSADKVYKILFEGIEPQKYHNFDETYFQSERGKNIFVTTGEIGFRVASGFAYAASKAHDKPAVVVEARVPKKYWDRFAKEDERLKKEYALTGSVNPESYELPEVKPEWITNLYDMNHRPMTETIDSLRLEYFKKADDDYVTIYIPMLQSNLERMFKKEVEKSQFVIVEPVQPIRFVILEKAKPYTRYRRGKLEHVRGYPGRMRKPEKVERTELEWGAVEHQTTVKLLIRRQQPGDIKLLESLGFKYLEKEKNVNLQWYDDEKNKWVSENFNEMDVLESRHGAKIYFNPNDFPDVTDEELRNWDSIFESAKKVDNKGGEPLPRIVYPGKTRTGEKFKWEEAETEKMERESETAGECDYSNKTIVIWDNHRGWWIDAHEVGHMVLSNLVNRYGANTPEKVRYEELEKKIGNLRWLISPSDYNMTLEIVKKYKEDFQWLFERMEDFDLPPSSLRVNPNSEMRQKIENDMRGFGLEPANGGWQAVEVIYDRMKELGYKAGQEITDLPPLSKEEKQLMKDFQNAHQDWHRRIKIFDEWEKICWNSKTEEGEKFNKPPENYPLAQSWDDPKTYTDINQYANRNALEQFAEFYRFFSHNLFEIRTGAEERWKKTYPMRHGEYMKEQKRAWVNLENMRLTNPKKFEFFIKEVFSKEYKKFKKWVNERKKMTDWEIALEQRKILGDYFATEKEMETMKVVPDHLSEVIAGDRWKEVYPSDEDITRDRLTRAERKQMNTSKKERKSEWKEVEVKRE